MASTVIQVNTTSTGGPASPSTIQFTTQNVTAGSLLIAVVRMGATGRTGATFSDSQGNTWTTVLVGTNINAVDTYFGYALNVIGGTMDTVRFAYSGSVLNNIISIGEYPAANANTLNTSATLTTGATSSNPATPNVTPAIGDLLIGAWNLGGLTTASLTAGTCGASATLSEKGTSGAGTYNAFEDGIANSSASQKATLTYASSSTYAGSLFAFSPPASGGATNSSWLSGDLNGSMRGLRK